MLRAPLAALLAGFLLVQPSGIRPARAEEAPSAGCADTAERVAFVRERLDADARDGRRWRWEWTIAYGALALGQVGLAQLRDDRGERAELYVGAVKSALGLLPVLVLPMPVLADAERLAAHATNARPEEQCAVVAEADTMLAEVSADEAFNRGFLAHAGNVLVNGGGLLVIGLGYDRWLTGALGTAVGIAVGELQIFTRPTAVLRGRDAYRARWLVTPAVSVDSAGLQLVGVF